MYINSFITLIFYRHLPYVNIHWMFCAAYSWQVVPYAAPCSACWQHSMLLLTIHELNNYLHILLCAANKVLQCSLFYYYHTASSLQTSKKKKKKNLGENKSHMGQTALLLAWIILTPLQSMGQILTSSKWSQCQRNQSSSLGPNLPTPCFPAQTPFSSPNTKNQSPSSPLSRQLWLLAQDCGHLGTNFYLQLLLQLQTLLWRCSSSLPLFSQTRIVYSKLHLLQQRQIETYSSRTPVSGGFSLPGKQLNTQITFLSLPT